MSTPTWPASLPQAPRVQGLGETMPDTVIRSGVDAGPAKVRRRISMNVRPWSMVLDLTAAQAVTLDQFFQVTTLGGSLRFTWKNPRTGNSATFRFVGQPSMSPLRPRAGGRFRAEFNLEQLPPLDATGVFQPGGGGGGDPVPNHTLEGALGEFEFSEDSMIVLTLWSYCTNGSSYTNQVSRELTLDFSQVTGTPTDTIEWAFTDGDGTTTVGFSADTGWYHSIDADHAPVPTCSGTSEVYPDLEADETDAPLFLHNGIPEVTGGNAAGFCSGSGFGGFAGGEVGGGGEAGATVAWAMTAQAVLQPGSSATSAERASGYRQYVAVCEVVP